MESVLPRSHTFSPSRSRHVSEGSGPLETWFGRVHPTRLMHPARLMHPSRLVLLSIRKRMSSPQETRRYGPRSSGFQLLTFRFLPTTISPALLMCSNYPQ